MRNLSYKNLLILSASTLFLTISCVSSNPRENSYSYNHLTKKTAPAATKLKTIKYPKISANQPDSFYLKIINEDLARYIEKFGKYDGYFKVGKEYQIYGISYFPKNYENYEEVGVASWYGDAFHGKLTANGETYDMKSMTAAHKTLPLPSIVRVTNLDNNNSVIVRINDRGPFAKSRIIDLSERAATALEFKNKGTAKVKVELLRDDTNKLLANLKLN